MSNSLVQAQFGAHAANYVASAAHAAGESLDHLRDWMAARRPNRLLDLATGGGHTALALGSACPQVLATDITFPMLLAARSFLHEHGAHATKFALHNAAQLPFSGACFDAVTCRLAAHHFAAPDQFVTESVRCLRKDGCLAVIDNVAPDNLAAAALVNAFEKLRDPSHGRHQTAAHWEAMFAAHRLRVALSQPYRKTLNFADYCMRMSVPAHTRTQLIALLLQAPAAVHSYFNPRTIDGALWFDLHEILIIGTLEE
jgi:SAM-dependent methyltransferase